MKQKGYITATLAILAMLGFLAVMAVLVTHEIPISNRDFFNTGLIALVGFVSTAFGYYLGSSFGSARKTNLLAPPPGSAGMGEHDRLGEAGFARFSLLMVLLAVAFLAIMCTINGCSTMKKEPPQVTAGKALLATKQTIVTAATVTDSLCRAGKLAPDKCADAYRAYQEAKRGYDAAVDAYLLMQVGGDPAEATAAVRRVEAIANNLLYLNGGAK